MGLWAYIALYGAISSATTLDFTRTPAYRVKMISNTLMNEVLGLPRLKNIRFSSPISDTDAQLILESPDGSRLDAACVLIAPSQTLSTNRVFRHIVNGSLVTEIYTDSMQ
ncbi:hypothetical protein C8R44DRAFT_794825 [Mycena epipterygia]|nr:hypothetical protein C8R44DRAFT_813592 [Mycena epipterygia]KAJ7114739.1 hypothetical protein C8R44DRAFT_794825 [Mycena epipterygia]